MPRKPGHPAPKNAPKPIISTPLPTALPAHETRARRQRAGVLRLPAVPGLTPPRKPKPKPQPGRKTIDTRLLVPGTGLPARGFLGPKYPEGLHG